MAELINEMILPGTYITVNTEGLLTIGAIATGNIGIVGTAEMGSGEIATLSSFEEGRARFGEITTWDSADLTAENGNLTLVRALSLLFDNGASTVYALRVFDDSTAKAATFDILGDTDSPVLNLKAKTPGTWGNRLMIRIEDAEQDELVENEQIIRSNGTVALTAQEVRSASDPSVSIGSVTVRESGLTQKYQIITGGATDESVQIAPQTRELTFPNTPPTSAEISASYWVPKAKLRRVTLRYGNVQEVYTVPSVAYLAQRISDKLNPSRLVEVVTANSSTNQNVLPKTVVQFTAFRAGENGTVSVEKFRDALERLVDQPVQIVIVAGLQFSTIKAAMLGHVEKTENLGRERIALLGATNSDPEKVLDNANSIADKRVVLVAPSLMQTDSDTGRGVILPPYFAAAAIAGKLSSLSPHISLTNKTLAGIDGLEREYNYGELKSLVQNRVLVLQTKRGTRVVKGISTDDGAFKQISIRRIVDYVKEGTRIGCNQYIGKLNNRRVRENLRTTLDSFLADLLIREFLTNYRLTVMADRAMEIRGEVQVVMDLQPTFSIDYIRVTMNLS